MKCKYYKRIDHDGCKIEVCPENVDQGCNIIKPKPKMVRIKAWAWMEGKYIRLCRVNREYIEAIGQVPIPCFILIEKKYIKGAK